MLLVADRLMSPLEVMFEPVMLMFPVVFFRLVKSGVVLLALAISESDLVVSLVLVLFAPAKFQLLSGMVMTIFPDGR